MDATRFEDADVEDAGAAPGYPRDVARVLSHLANLIDGTIALRGVGIGVREWAAAFLRASVTDTVVCSEMLDTIGFQLLALELARELSTHPPAGIIGEDQEEPPRWERLDLGELTEHVPVALAAAYPAGTVASCPLIVAVDEPFHRQFVVQVYTRAHDAQAGRSYLADLLARGRARNPFRGRTLEARTHPTFGLTFRIVRPEPAGRDDIVLAARVWTELDRNVHGLFAGVERLRSAGLAVNRGVLLEGPPGTGKTAVCRVLANELEGVTVVFCDARVIASDVRTVYRQLVDLGPALVVMEDIDLVAGERGRSRDASSLNDFLLALDGALSDHAGVVTIATTNDADAIDPAAKRAARFDRIVSVPHPDRAGRAAILRRYLRALDADVDVDRVAAAAVGASGADLRELVTEAVLRTPGSVTTALLLEIAAERGYASGAGLYL